MRNASEPCRTQNTFIKHNSFITFWDCATDSYNFPAVAPDIQRLLGIGKMFDHFFDIRAPDIGKQ